MTPKSKEELREQVQGLIYDSAINYSNGHTTDFYEVADTIITTLQRQHEKELVEARVDELKKLPSTGVIGQNGIRQQWTPYQIIQDHIAQLSADEGKMK